MGANKGGNYTNKSNFVGTNYNDTIGGTAGADLLAGGNGDDTINGGAGNDMLWGDSFSNSDANDNGQDKLYGEAGNDKIHGGNGKDYLNGGLDDDELYGENGIDVMDGGAGNDRLEGGRAGDYNHGGAGNDTFVYTTNTLSEVSDSVYVQGAAGATVATVTDATSWNKTWDVIDDFDAAGGNDVIDLSQISSFINHSLTWRIANGSDTTAGQAEIGRAYGVWSDSSHTFIYADITGDGAADMKIQVSNVEGDDFIGVTLDTALNVTTSLVDDDGELCTHDMTAELRIAFGEAVLNFSEADLDVVGGSLSGGHWDGFTYVATFTAADDFDGQGSVSFKAGNDVTDWSGNAPAGTLIATIDIDTKPPVITSLTIEDGSDDTINIAENAAVSGSHTGVAVQIAFDDVVHLMDASLISVTAGATLSGFELAPDGMSGTAYLTISDTSLTSVTVTIGAGAFGDDCDNPTAESSVTAAVDLSAPTVSITSEASELCGDHASTLVTISFSEDVTGFDQSDLTLAGGTLSNWTMVNAHEWTATFTADANYDSDDGVGGEGGGVSLTGSYTDGAGNSGGSGNLALDIDTISPTATIMLAAGAISTLTDAQPTTTLTVTFSEPVTGLEAGDFSFDHGTVDSLVANMDGTYTLTVTASDGYDGPATVSLSAGSYTDDCNPGGEATFTGLTIDRYEAPPPAPTVDHIAFVPTGDYDHNGSGVGTIGHFVAYDAVGNVIAGLNWSTAVSDKIVVDANGNLNAISPINSNSDAMFTLFGTDVHIDLGTGTGDSLGNTYVGGASDLQIVLGYSGGDSLGGGNLGDTLWGGNGDDILIGSAGDDYLIGGAGMDSLAGGSGADHFIFRDGDSGLTVSTRDVISDFADAQDVIDLTAMGLTSLSNSALSANGAFVFQSGGNTFLNADTDGNGTADFSIMLQGIHSLDTTNVLI